MKKIKLPIQDYVFEYQNKDCTNAELKYEFKEISTISFKDDKKIDDKSPCIFFEINAFNDKKEYELDFSLDMTLESLNKLNNEITLINDKIHFIEFYDDGIFQDPNVNNTIYTKSNNVYVLKKHNNDFIFKIEFFEINLFIWFNVKFKS